MIQGKGFSSYHESRGQDWFQWVRYGFFHRKPVNERSKWSDAVRVRIPTIRKSNFRTSEATKGTSADNFEHFLAKNPWQEL